MLRRDRQALRLAAACLAALALGVLHPATPRGASPNVVISQVYGGGGNSGATYTNDFIELFNRGDAPVSLAGWTVQYASAAGSTWSATNLSGTIPAGGYYLVQQAQGAGGTVSLPAPDATGSIAMSATAGKVALVHTTTRLSGTCPAGSAIVDFVGFGGANCAETAPTPALTNTTAAIRGGAGCADSDDNSEDFSTGAATPRNSGTESNLCDGPPPLPSISVDDVSVIEGNGGPTTATVTVSLSSPAPAGGVTFDVGTADGTATAPGGDYVALALSSEVISAGGTSYQFAVTVNADTAIEADETFTVTVGNVSGATLGDATGIVTIVNDDFLAAPIHAIQGDGLVSPLTGTPVTTTGVVTAVKQNGFFIQSPDHAVDGDIETSEGLFVFTAAAPAVTPGDLVRVQGTASEFFELTQIESRFPGSVTVLSAGQPLPSAVVLTPAILDRNGRPTQLERLEGMRVQAPLTSVAPTNDFGEIYAVLSGVKRPRREPGIETGLPIPPDPETGLTDCCVPVWDLNPERIMVDTDGLLGSATQWMTSNVTFSVDGPIDFTFGDYKVLPTAPLNASANMLAVPVRPAAADEFTVAGYNIENFSGSARQTRKAALNIRSVMRYPDVIGVIEIASRAALQSLADQVNADAVAAGDPNPRYVAELIPFGTGNQHVGFLVKSSRVQVERVSQERADETFTNPVTGITELLHDRPPLVLRAIVNPNSSHPARIIVVVNHLRSFIDIELVDGEGVRVRAKRTAQAEAIAGLLQDLQTDNPATPVISVGDYNAYEFSDGYTDPISIIKGRPSGGDEIVVAGSPDLVNPDFVNLTDSLPPSERYSFIFEGTPQALDHILVNRTAHAYLQQYAIARSNADFPGHSRAGLSTDPSRAEAHSDHDAPVAYFRIPGRR